MIRFPHIKRCISLRPAGPVEVRKARGRESGYALLMVIFFAAVMLVAASTIGLRVSTQGQREREMELEWRGKQYIRGVKMYYRKNGRFPRSMDDLTKPGVGIRFMRKAYKDPFSTDEGSGWRLIYVGPAGQLIGSVKAGSRVGLFGVAGAGVRPVMAGATPAGAMSSGMGTSGSSTDSTDTGSAFGSSSFGNGQRGGRGAIGATGSFSKSSSDDPFGSQSLSTGVGSDGTIVGGNIIGVASKIDKSSIRVYDGGTTYREWEFIYDPSKDRTTVGQPGTQIGTPIGAPGTNPKVDPNSPFRRGRRPPGR